MSPSRRRVPRLASAALGASALLLALLATSISPFVPGVAALDPTPDPSGSAPTEPATTPGPTATPDPTADPTATPDPTANPTATPDPGPTPDPAPTPDPGPTPAPAPSPADPTPEPTPTPAPTTSPPPDEVPIYELIVPVPAELVDPSIPSPHALDSLVSDGCGACHRATASEGKLLVATYRTDLKPASEAYLRSEFGLCYTCHDPDPFEAAGTGGTNFDLHAQHLGGIGSVGDAVCAECHDRLHATAAETGSKLVNFAPNVQPSQLGTLEWTGTVGRSCTLTCHGFEHVTEGY
jgi:hypothetical protein